MKKIVIIAIVLIVVALGLLICFNLDDTDNFITGINAAPLSITPVTGEIGTVFNESAEAAIIGPDSKTKSKELKLLGGTWISPSKAIISNAHRYATISCYVDVRNATKNTATYTICTRDPDYYELPYIALPQSWISVEKTNIVVLPEQVLRVPVTINIPKSIPAKKLEFWISVKNNNMSGMVKTELCAKWFVNIR